MKEKKLVKKGVKILIAVLAVLVVLVGAGAVFVMDYYPADETALSCLAEGADGVTVTVTDSEIVFMPDEPQAGFIFYPGAKVSTEAYAPLLCDLAEEGICCVAVRVPLRLAVLDMDAADGIEEQFPEISEWYVGGHSLGGAVSAIYLEKHTGDFAGLILLGAYSTKDLSGTDLRVLLIYGENDGVLNRTNYEKDKGNLPADVTEIVISGGNHAYFGSYGEQKGDGTAAITPTAQQEFAAGAMAEWIFK